MGNLKTIFRSKMHYELVVARLADRAVEDARVGREETVERLNVFERELQEARREHAQKRPDALQTHEARVQATLADLLAEYT